MRGSPSVEAVCRYCKTTFLTHPYRIKEGVKFCSPECHYASYREYRECEYCGNDIILTRAEIKKGKSFDPKCLRETIIPVNVVTKEVAC